MLANHDQAINCFQNRRRTIFGLKVIVKKIILKKKVENWNNEKEIDEARLQYYSNKFGSIMASTIKGNVLS